MLQDPKTDSPTCSSQRETRVACAENLTPQNRPSPQAKGDSSQSESPTTTNGRLFKFRLDKNVSNSPQVSATQVRSSTSTIEEFSHCLVTEKCIDYTNKNAKRRKRMVEIPAHRIVSHLVFPASFAAKRLGVSVSTLKRRLVELDCGSGRWPVGETQSFPKGFIQTNRTRVVIKDLLNPCDNEDGTKHLTDVTESVLRCAFRQHLFSTL